MSTYETLTPDQQTSIDNAINLLTFEQAFNMSYNDEIEISNDVCLYHYSEDKCIVLNIISEWVEVYQIQYNTNTKDLIFEEL